MNGTLTQPYCVACLSYDRKLRPIQDLPFFTSLTLIKLSDAHNTALCWECNAVVKRAKLFRQKVFKVQEILNGSITLSDAHNTALCWECNAVVKRAKLFRQKVFKVQEILNGSITWNNLPLSIMCQKDLPSIHIEPLSFIEPLEITTEQVPKSEITENDPEQRDPIDMDHGEMDQDLEVKLEECDCEDETLSQIKGGIIIENGPEQHDPIGMDHGEIDHHIEMKQEECDCEDKILSKIKGGKITENGPEQRDRIGMDHGEIDQDLEVKQEDIDSEDETLSQIKGGKIIENGPEQRDPIGTDHGEMDQDLEVKKESDSEDETLSQIKGEKTSSKIIHNESIENKNFNRNQLEILTSKLARENITVQTMKRLPQSQEEERNKSYTIKILSEEELIELRKKMLQEIRDKNRKFVCELCVESFKKDVLLASHMRIHDVSSGAFACRICERRFQTDRFMKAHTEIHYRMFACNKCKKVLPSLFKYTRHYDIHHDPNLTKCDQCGATFRSKRNLVIHKRTHKGRAQCPVCQKLVKSYLLNNHLLIHKRHPTLECDVCHKKYDGKHRLEAHKRNTHKQKDDGAFCVECNKRFKSVSIYKRHLERSSKHARQEEQQQCPHCDRKFACKNYLKGHIQRTHIDTSGFTCDQCKELFVSKRSLRRHVLKVHEKRVAPKDKICDICGKGFQLSIVLRQHMNGHMNIRPYKCEHCGDTFTNNGARYTHVKLKHKKKEPKKPSSATDS